MAAGAGESEEMKTEQIQRSEGKQKGVLLPVFSLPSKHGPGCLSREALEFIDWLAATGHTYWQVLPPNPTGRGGSPYLSPSSLAENPDFIDPEQLARQGLLDEADLGGWAEKPQRTELLKKAHRRFFAGEWDGPEEAGGGTSGETTDGGASGSEAADGDAGGGAIAFPVCLSRGDYDAFRAENGEWLENFALFMTLRDRYGEDTEWTDWPEELCFRDADALKRVEKENGEEVDFYRWTQYVVHRQWMAVKARANAAGIGIVGDLPFYVAGNSADCWANPKQFQLDEDLRPQMVAGVPPDYFSAEGQMWGNPLYDWETMKADGYAWWKRRIARSFELFDVMRLDHFRAFEAYYAIPADAENAIGGHWIPGPGMDFFRAIGETVPAASMRRCLIAEDLGTLTDGVRRLLAESGLPGMKILQFAFDGNPGNPYLTENFGENCVAYTGTHDNDTTVGWFRSLDPAAQKGILQYLGKTWEEANGLVEEWVQRQSQPGAGCDAADPAAPAAGPAAPAADPAVLTTDLMIERLMASRADLVIIPMQDYLHLGSEARTNVPGTIGGNWTWQMETGEGL